ncbi:hypothetical protein [Isoptericola cucumis]|uniref:Uncharacterized protein n=1 Tax=Isoptericola cucumis TaxID=1776856 RepID=A0ABQ2B3I1_9MICO|nr:hypothetical protein [Isoptericola cucumis]GGI04269.1 hypothetical protein GCM10007368_00300 [Isoptericola cucumis]
MGDRQVGPHEAARRESSTEAQSSRREKEAAVARWKDDGGMVPDVVTGADPDPDTNEAGEAR